MRVRHGLVAVVAVVGTSACGASAGPDSGPAPSSAASSSRPATTPGPTASPDPAPPGPITIAFAGDVHFESQLRARLDDPATALAPIAPQLTSADLTVVNLETSIGTGGNPELKRFTFQAPPQAFDALAAAGVDVVTMANNHGMDFGQGGLADTLAAVPRAPLSVVGIGPDEDAAFAPALHEVDGTTVAVIGASSADDPTADPTAHWAAGTGTPGIAVANPPARLVDEVRAARSAADVVVVFMHWGIQGDDCPSASQVALARALSDAGADIVVGTHAHVVQGAGMLDETYIAYGLGNFVWYTSGSEAASTTGVLTLTVANGQVVDETWAPARIQADGLPLFSTGAAAAAATAAFAEQRACTDLAAL